MAVKFTFYGAMCVLVERSDGKKLLFDPYITENPQTDVSLDIFNDIDYLFVTHNAGDHFGDSDVIMQNASKAILISGKDVNRHVQKLVKLPRDRWFGTIYGDTRALDDVTTYHTVNAIHRSKETTNGAEASHPAFGFIVEVEPGVTYYHVGDTCLFSDMKMYRELYHPNVMTVGISSFKAPYPPCEMPPREAAYAVSYVGPDVVIPTHYPVGSKAPEEFKKHMETLAPQVTIKGDIEKPFLYIPSRVEDVI
ncbi:MAG: MBL fold metallo-hydrolase [Lachnospiraceae bacterium]|nr:MBL fold metallo-hydrolase [Lachnospiraceae bacterium]